MGNAVDLVFCIYLNVIKTHTHLSLSPPFPGSRGEPSCLRSPRLGPGRVARCTPLKETLRHLCRGRSVTISSRATLLVNCEATTCHETPDVSVTADWKMYLCQKLSGKAADDRRNPELTGAGIWRPGPGETPALGRLPVHHP